MVEGLYKLTFHSMNKADLVEAIHGAVGGTKKSAEDAMEKVLSSIVDTLKRGEEVSISSFGIFSVKQRAAREARNPKTGAAIHVPATRVPKFRAAKALKDAVK